MIAVIVGLVLFAGLFGGLTFLAVRHAQREIERADRRHEEEIRRVLAQNEEALRRAHEAYDKVLASQTAAIERAFNLANFGTTARPEATSAEGDTTAPQRLARVIDEETVARATDALRAQYKELGLDLPDAELEMEARSLVMGTGFIPGETLRERLAIS